MSSTKVAPVDQIFPRYSNLPIAPIHYDGTAGVKFPTTSPAAPAQGKAQQTKIDAAKSVRQRSEQAKRDARNALELKNQENRAGLIETLAPRSDAGTEVLQNLPTVVASMAAQSAHDAQPEPLSQGDLATNREHNPAFIAPKRPTRASSSSGSAARSSPALDALQSLNEEQTPNPHVPGGHSAPASLSQAEAQEAANHALADVQQLPPPTTAATDTLFAYAASASMSMLNKTSQKLLRQAEAMMSMRLRA